MASRFLNLESSVLADRDARTASRWPGSVLRRIYTRIGAAARISPRRLVDVDLAASPFAALSEATLSADARLRSMLKPDGMYLGLWIHNHGSRLKANGAPQCTPRESR